MNTQETLNLLGLDLTTKETLAQNLGVSKVTLYKYHDVALRLPDFVNDYPVIGNKTFTSHPMTKYQVWVLSYMIKSLKGKSIALLYETVKNPNIAANLSRAAYQMSETSCNQDILSALVVVVA